MEGQGSGWNPGGSQKARHQPRAWEVGRVVGWGSRGAGALGPRAFAMFPGSLRVREESCPAAAWASLSEKGRC